MLIHCSALYGVPDGLEERSVPLVHHDRKLRLPRVVKVARDPPARSGSADTPARGTLPHRRGLRCTPRATPGFPASCPGSQSAGSSSSSETSESTRTVREAQLAGGG